MPYKTFLGYTFIIFIAVTTLWYLSLPFSSSRAKYKNIKSTSINNTNTSSKLTSNPQPSSRKELDNNSNIPSEAKKSISFKLSNELLLEARNLSCPHVRSTNSNAVTIVGFFDFLDSKCVAMYKTIDKIACSGRVNYIFRDFPTYKLPVDVSFAAFKAYILNFSSHLNFRSKLIDLAPNYNYNAINKIADELGLNPIFANLEFFNHKMGNYIGFEDNGTLDLATKLNINTNSAHPGSPIYPLPVFIIGDTFISGVLTESELLNIITNEEVKKSTNETILKPILPLEFEERYLIDEDSEITIKKYYQELFQLDKNSYSAINSISDKAVTVIGFCDFSDEKCQYMLPIIEKLTESKKINYVFRDFLFQADNQEDAIYNIKDVAINPFLTSLIGLPANYIYFNTLPTLFRILKENPWITFKDTYGILAELGLLLYLQQPLMGAQAAQRDMIRITWELAQKISVNATPTFIIGDKFIVRGIISYDSFLDLVNKAEPSSALVYTPK